MSQSAPPAEEPSMLTLEERLAVVNLYEELGSYRAVAAVVGCDHKTVKAVIERGRRIAHPAHWRRRLKLTDPFLEMVEQKVENSRGRIRSRPLLRLLRAAGYEGSLRTLQRALVPIPVIPNTQSGRIRTGNPIENGQGRSGATPRRIRLSGAV